jgi:hypothetical protein
LFQITIQPINDVFGVRNELNSRWIHSSQFIPNT